MNLNWLFILKDRYWHLLLFLLIQEIGAGTVIKTIEPEILDGPANAKVFKHSSHTFVCRARGAPHLRIAWQGKLTREDRWQDIDKGTGRYNISTERDGKFGKKSRLGFERVLATDAGLYRCLAVVNDNRSAVVNGNRSAVSTTVDLIVHERAEIVTAPVSQVVKWGEVVRMECGVAGLPPPLRMWFQDGVQVLQDDQTLTAPFFVFRANHSCTITCQATNNHFNGTTTTVSSPAHLTVIDFQTDGACVPLSNDACRSQLAYTSVYQQLSQPDHLSRANQLVRQLLNDFHNFSLPPTSENLPSTTHTMLIPPPSSSSSSSLSSSSSSSSLSSTTFLSPSCFQHLQRMLCHYSNPQCIEGGDDDDDEGGDDDDGKQAPQVVTLCRESCEVVEHLHCGLWWQQQNASIDCSHLPSLHHTNTCLHFDLSQLHNRTRDYTCYNGVGETYTGVVNSTSSGRVCQKWIDREPHKHALSPSFIPHLSLNHCRNPAGLRQKPWCFTTDPAVPWEYCDVPSCGSTSVRESHLALGTGASKLTNTTELGMGLLLLAALVALMITLALLAFVTFVFLKRRRKKKRGLIEEVLGLTSMPLNSSNHFHNHNSNNLKSLPPMLDRNAVVYVEDIADGAFGLVFKAFLSLDVRQAGVAREDEFVAIKMLKQDTNEATRVEFVRQASVMCQLKHPNILKLLGVCFVGDPCWVAVEFMQRGDLRSYLPKLKLHSPDTCLLQQLSISVQIASALQYLEHRRFLHRDLAARNFLVSASDVTDGAPLTKLADFTFTIELQAGKEAYVGLEDEAIAVRWAAPEAIQIGFFSFASDVWSFGVVLWEVFSFSAQPYQKFKQFDEISKHVRKGGILPDPCPDHPAIYRLIRKCWSLTSEERCSSTHLLSELQALLTQNHEHKVS